MQTLASPILWPNHAPSYNSSTLLATYGSLDAASEYNGFVHIASEAMTIERVGFTTGSVTTSPTAEVRVETVDALTGFPSGTLWNSPTNTTNGTSGTLSSNTWNEVALTASASITAGQAFAVKVVYASGGSINTRQISRFNCATVNPYFMSNTSGSDVAAVQTTGFCIGVGSSSSAWYHIPTMYPGLANTFADNTFNNTNSAKRGMRFKIPFKARCVGIRHHLGATTGDYNAILADDTGNELSSSSTAFDGNIRANVATGTSRVRFDNPVTLSPDTWYRAVIEPSSATNCSITMATLANANLRSGWPSGVNCHYTVFATSLPYDDSNTSILPIMDIIIDQLDDGVSAGGQVARVIGG